MPQYLWHISCIYITQCIKKEVNRIKMAKKKETENKSTKTKAKPKSGKTQNLASQQIAAKDEEIKELNDKFLRAHAEMENYKKRMQQEKENFFKYSDEKTIKELLPVLDSFDLAIEHSEKEKAHEKKEEIIKGFTLIRKQLDTMLEKMGVTPIEAVGQKFDPNFHQAVLQEENKKAKVDTILKQVQKGYKLHDRVIRASMVVVAK